MIASGVDKTVGGPFDPDVQLHDLEFIDCAVRRAGRLLAAKDPVLRMAGSRHAAYFDGKSWARIL